MTDNEFEQAARGTITVSVREYFERIIRELDRRLTDRAEAQDKAVSAALIAAERQTAQSFAASEKAISKAENSQREYNQGHNDLSRKMEAQYASMVPSSEAKLKWESIDKDIAGLRSEIAINRETNSKDVNNLRQELMREISGLRESRSAASGATEQRVEGIRRNEWVIGLCIFAGLTILGIIIRLFK